MNGTQPEMLRCLQTPGNLAGNSTDITIIERQRSRQKWEQHQNLKFHQDIENQSYFDGTHFNNFLQLPSLTSNFDLDFIKNNMMNREVSSSKTDLNFVNGWPDFGKYPVIRNDFSEDNNNNNNSIATDFGTNNSVEMENYLMISRTSSCPPAMGHNILPTVSNIGLVTEETSREMGSSGKMASKVGKESFKRNSDKAQISKVGIDMDQTREKRIKIDAEEVESKITHEQKKTTTKRESTSGESSKENSKISDVHNKQDYIHVRARRGQATDSHSLAERVRREKISERMKYLQDLVPGCNKITGKAGMLDEIINYVQSLQKQVEFLSMKLATVNPRLDFNIENLLTKDMFQACTGIIPNIGLPQEMANCPAYLPNFNPVQEMISSCGLDMVLNPPEMEVNLGRTTSAPVTAPPETFMDTSCFTQEQPTLTWESDLQNLYRMEEFQQGRTPTVLPPQSFTGGTMEMNSNLKMEEM